MAARYRHQIIIQTPSESTNTFGEVEETWSTLITCWASMQPVSGSETFDAGSEVEVGRYRFETYYNSSITTECRISYDSRYFDIQSVLQVNGIKRKLEIMAVETNAN